MSYLTEPKVTVSAQIAREQREALQRPAVEEDRTLSAVVRRVIADYLNGNERSSEGGRRRLSSTLVRHGLRPLKMIRDQRVPVTRSSSKVEQRIVRQFGRVVDVR
jgi:hypothetical protein